MNTSSSSYPIEIKVISGEGLKYNRKKITEKNSFVIVRIDSDNFQITDLNSGEKLMFDIPTNLHFVTIEVFYKGRFGNKLVGVTRIPVVDFIGGYIPANCLHLLSYRLRDKNTDRCGIINVSLKVKMPPKPAPVKVNSGFGWRKTSGKVVAGEVKGRVVTGVPIWYQYRV